MWETGRCVRVRAAAVALCPAPTGAAAGSGSAGTIPAVRAAACALAKQFPEFNPCNFFLVLLCSRGSAKPNPVFLFSNL